VTQDVHIPWRPAGHPDCDLTSNGPSGDRDRGWKDAEGKCVNVSGIPFTADFNFSGEGIVVPHDAIFSITMNTRQYGDATTGGRAPIDKVNVGLNGNTSAVAVGQDQNPGAFYLRYGSPEFREIAWGQPYNLGIKVTATTDGVAPEVKVNL